MSSAELARFKTRIYEHCGLLLEGIAEDRLRKAIQKSATQAGCIGLDAYYRLINSDTEEFDALISQLTVNETYFFREPEQIQLFSKVLIPRLLEHRSGHQPIRILSAGCSSGEEPYSLVMALQEEYGSRTRELFHFDAGDLDQQILAKARRGVYSAFSFRGVDEQLQKRYFQPLQTGYQLSADIREQVHLHELNLLAPVFPAGLKNYDLIFFRNVSIYFDMDARQLIHRKFYDLMKDDGILLLGSSETLGNDLGVFELVEEAGQYFFVKGDVYKPSGSQAVGWGHGALYRQPVAQPQAVPAAPLLIQVPPEVVEP
ncbi:MAG: protein-glutamate O-methyltransferase CheR, partial [Marinospirillum sp.]|uniref:CheR family methyltransferase n=1 Tax=Marinospirillum sp. TaxID=2183934 RepID=UPI0019E5AB73